MSARDAVRLVARREITERSREKAFAVSTGINIVIIVAVVIIASIVGGDGETYQVGWSTENERAVVQAAADAGRAADVTIEARQVGSPGPPADVALEDGSLDAVVIDGQIRSKEDPDDELVTLLQSANRQVQAVDTLEQAGVSADEARRALAPPPLEISTLEPPDEDDGKAGVAFFAAIILYGQLLTYGYWVAAGVVEEKASRVIELVLSTIRPAHLLAGKVIGIGLLGLANLLVTVAIGLGVAQVTGALEIDGDLITAALLALAWFVVGYAFYACAFACGGALVPRQEELQSSLTPLTLIILVAFFASFPVLDDPDGTLARVTAFIPMTAPITMPPRIVTGDAAAWEIAASLAVTIGASVALIPLAARIYSGGVLRTGSALKLREAWRAARA
jgi:ABC-2 type transport system permease protein